MFSVKDRNQIVEELFEAYLSVSNADIERVREVLSMLTQTSPTPEALAFLTEKLRSDKFDVYIPDALAREAFINDRLELNALAPIANQLLTGTLAT